MMLRARRAVWVAPLVLAGCGPNEQQIAAAVLLFSPLVYLLAMAIVYPLHAAWQSVRPGLQFGRDSHATSLTLLVGAALIAGPKADADLVVLVLWLFGTCVLAWWLVLARLTMRSGWGVRWGGLVVIAVLLAPMMGALTSTGALRSSFVGGAAAVYVYTGWLGLLPLILYIFMMVEASRVRRTVLAAMAEPDAAATAGGDAQQVDGAAQ